MVAAGDVARAIADRVIDEDDAIRVGRESSVGGDVAERMVRGLEEIVRAPSVSDAEALDWADAAAAIAAEMWIDSEGGRAALRAAGRALRRDERVIGRGLTARTARRLERVSQTAIATRLLERDSERAGDSEVERVRSAAEADSREGEGST